MKKRILEFDTLGLEEDHYISYTQGVLDALLETVHVEWDESPPDFSYYKVCVSPKRSGRLSTRKGKK